MKKLLLSSLVLASVLMGEKIVIGATPVPHAEILEVAKASLEAQGYELEIKVFNDYVLPNKALADKDLDVNFMQHEPYLREFNAMNGTRLEPVFGVHLEPMGAYSKSIKSLAELKDGDKIAIPNDPTNESRALDLLAKNGLIELDTKVKLRTPMDITKNPKNLKFVELDGATLPRALDEVSLAVINSNFALNANLNPKSDSIISEDAINNPYSNIVVVRADEVYGKKAIALKKAILSDEVKKFINEKYKGAVIPSF
ncbi:MetQ/NlpA family ABC transporter substrate-binding protein [Campylobacter sp.]|uniref:MetQ/NlpA family ABC transporter substrate-binding protein n=1 Tax=Campylobacter sp. TaxID=205 RepID=UPI002A80F486|nr:MetQ/NlpA family ABC transporter substrate-binding protein [Campylobacter sp.]MCI6564459.1 MetQ/NlpA family ABC transporter substrate-binding protein [Campylobacter sp.]MCI7582057.1 MetQ/NlpA family ABC transporter substrate-binding protein [Campylobacter sp.]MDY4013755.1 MetQ/NlpA family ABC transporter substrate-binding protein [Campylobacter sp.]MDY4802640.1 MetQ/NlpA family ABC transporter substrate-binding protein [Campylobacter sp.]